VRHSNQTICDDDNHQRSETMNTKRSFLWGGLSDLILIVAVIGLMAALTLPARAQFNQFAEPRALVLTSPTLISGAAAGNLTNAWVDTHGMAGIGTVTFFSCTNINAGAMTVTLEASSDGTNAVAFGNYARATATDVTYTNRYYPTAFNVTNTFLLPGTVVTPTAATAGFATPYLSSAEFTNSGALTVTARGIYQIAYNVGDAPRYVRAIWAPSGSGTNVSVGAVLSARKTNFP
jgi:hypothetical protein